MKTGKWVIIVLTLAVALCGETFYTITMTQPNEFSTLQSPDNFRIVQFVFTSNNSARVLIINDGRSAVTLKDFVLVNGMNATVAPLGYPTPSIPKESQANFTVTLREGNQFIPNVEYTFVIETTHESHSYVTRLFYAELC